MLLVDDRCHDDALLTESYGPANNGAMIQVNVVVSMSVVAPIALKAEEKNENCLNFIINFMDHAWSST